MKPLRPIAATLGLLLVGAGLAFAYSSTTSAQAGPAETVITAGSPWATLRLPHLPGQLAIHLPTASPTAASPAASPTPIPAIRTEPGRRVVPPPIFDGQSAVILDVDSGRWLYLFNPHDRRTPASVTKIFTAMVAADLMSLDRVVTVPVAAVRLPPDSTLMGLSAGEQVSVRQLLYGVFLNSGNDAAETLAQSVTSRDAFIALMNAKAARLGLIDTRFANPTGLDADNHYSTAFDLALAARYLDSHYPALAAIASTPALVIPAAATHKQYTLSNLNKLLKTYPGVTGLKTGWTGIAGGCLDATATRSGHHLIAVLLGSQSLYKSTSALLDYGFERVGVLPVP